MVRLAGAYLSIYVLSVYLLSIYLCAICLLSKYELSDYLLYIYLSRISNYSLDEMEVRLGQLERTTDGLCAGADSLPVLAVDLQKHCNLLEVNFDFKIQIYTFMFTNLYFWAVLLGGISFHVSSRVFCLSIKIPLTPKCLIKFIILVKVLGWCSAIPFLFLSLIMVLGYYSAHSLPLWMNLKMIRAKLIYAPCRSSTTCPKKLAVWRQ